MDALSFVLGVRASHLRSTHLKELIYRASEQDTTRRNCLVKVRPHGDAMALVDRWGRVATCVLLSPR